MSGPLLVLMNIQQPAPLSLTHILSTIPETKQIEENHTLISSMATSIALSSSSGHNSHPLQASEPTQSPSTSHAPNTIVANQKFPITNGRTRGNV